MQFFWCKKPLAFVKLHRSFIQYKFFLQLKSFTKYEKLKIVWSIHKILRNNGIVVKNTTWLHHQLDARKKVVGFTLKNLQFEPLHVNPDAYWLLQFLARLRYWAFLLNFSHFHNCWRKVDFFHILEKVNIIVCSKYITPFFSSLN